MLMTKHRAKRESMVRHDPNVPVLGAATGAVGLNVTWWAFLTASLAALAATPFRRQRANFPFGPWLAAGGAISVVLLG